MRRLTLPLYCYAHEWDTLGLFLELFISWHSVGRHSWASPGGAVPWEQRQAASLRQISQFQETRCLSPKSLRPEAAFLTLSRGYRMIESEPEGCPTGHVDQPPIRLSEPSSSKGLTVSPLMSPTGPSGPTQVLLAITASPEASLVQTKQL